MTYAEDQAKLRDYGEAVPKCPRCGRQAAISRTAHGPHASCCGLWSWGYRPLADRATHEARQRAHVAFDWLWTFGGLDREEAYRRLAAEMGVAPKDCHMALMSQDQAEEVVRAVNRLRWALPADQTR